MFAAFLVQPPLCIYITTHNCFLVWPVLTICCVVTHKDVWYATPTATVVIRRYRTCTISWNWKGEWVWILQPSYCSRLHAHNTQLTAHARVLIGPVLAMSYFITYIAVWYASPTATSVISRIRTGTISWNRKKNTLRYFQTISLKEFVLWKISWVL